MDVEDSPTMDPFGGSQSFARRELPRSKECILDFCRSALSQADHQPLTLCVAGRMLCYGEFAQKCLSRDATEQEKSSSFDRMGAIMMWSAYGPPHPRLRPWRINRAT